MRERDGELKLQMCDAGVIENEKFLQSWKEDWINKRYLHMTHRGSYRIRGHTEEGFCAVGTKKKIGNGTTHVTGVSAKSGQLVSNAYWCQNI